MQRFCCVVKFKGFHSLSNASFSYDSSLCTVLKVMSYFGIPRTAVWGGQLALVIPFIFVDSEGTTCTL